MLLRLSRVSICLAAAAALMALFGPIDRQPTFSDMALALGATAFLLWRAAVAMHQRRERLADAIPGPVPLDRTALHEAGRLVVQIAAEAADLEPTLHRIGELLRTELGARLLRVFAVVEHEGIVGVSELVATQPGFRAPWRSAASATSASVRALREECFCIDLPHVVAIPVVCGGRAVALLELSGIEIAIDEAALAELLANSARSLTVLGEAGTPLSASRSAHASILGPASRFLPGGPAFCPQPRPRSC